MPIKLGKSKSANGSELIHANQCPEEAGNQSKKNRSIRQFFNRSKGNSKSATSRSSAIEENSNNTHINLSQGKITDPINPSETESPSANSISPNLCSNGNQSSNDESTKTVLPSLIAPCSPIPDVIFEEDYEEALLLNNRTSSFNNSIVAKENIQQQISNIMINSHGIYNEPNDSTHGSKKEIIETCRLYQITPTNQFKEIRSRSGSGIDPLIVHPDSGVGGRCSTNSSSVGSAQTLSECSAIVSSSYSPQIYEDTRSYPIIPPQPKHITPSTKALSINIQSNTQSTSGPPTAYNNSPKGNTSICHHPSSPFVPPHLSKPSSASNPSTDIQALTDQSPSTSPTCFDTEEFRYSEPIKTSSPICSNVSRGSYGYDKRSVTASSHSSEKQNVDDPFSKSDIPQASKHSERHSEYHNQFPVYEVAWDLKLKRMCQDMTERSTQSSLDGATIKIPISNTFDTHACNRPQSARCGNDSPNSKLSTPPEVPPHRRSFIHTKLAHCNSLEDSKTSNNHSQCNETRCDGVLPKQTKEDISGQRSSLKSHLKHNINPTFDDMGVATDYDYAYNGTWSLGVQGNMTLNLSKDASAAPRTQLEESPPLNSSYTDKIDSVYSEASPSICQGNTCQNNESPICETVTNVNIDKEPSNVDNDSLSNDSYEEPWDVRHGRVISELTSARLIDPACMLSIHEQSTSSRNPSAPSRHINPNENHRPYRAREQSTRHSSNHCATRQRSTSGGRQTTCSSTIPMPTIINISIPLEEHLWYHGDCSRSQAEQMLVGSVEGSFLVRRSETCRSDYSLSIRHNNDYLHMKISRNSKGFILGQYSQPYITVPHMLHHYELTMVPVKGADSVILRNPIIR